MEADGIGSATRHSAFAALYAALSYAMQHDYVTSNVCERVPKPKIDSKKQIVILTRDELVWLLKVARQDALFPLVLLATQIGARQGELFALTWGCINFGERTLSIHATLTEDENGRLQATPAKTKKSVRTVELSDLALAVLARHYDTAGRPAPDTWVFTDTSGTPLRKSNFVRRYWHPLLKRAGVPDTNFHSLRHAFTTHCAEGDIPIDAVSATLGHADRRTTERFYNHARYVAGSRAVARAMDTMMADLMADHEAETLGLKQSKKPAKPNGDGLPVVVEVRRLELLTPYMRSKCSTS